MVSCERPHLADLAEAGARSGCFTEQSGQGFSGAASISLSSCLSRDEVLSALVQEYVGAWKNSGGTARLEFPGLLPNLEHWLVCLSSSVPQFLPGRLEAGKLALWHPAAMLYCPSLSFLRSPPEFLIVSVSASWRTQSREMGPCSRMVVSCT